MFDFNQISENLANLFGDKVTPVNPIKTGRDYHLISDLLPYRYFDEESKLFINQNSIGFIFEISPLVGANNETIDTLTGIITDGMPKGCTIQFINYASPKIDHIIAKWSKHRIEQGGIYKKLGQKRAEFFADKNFNPLSASNSLTLKNFRVFIAVSIPINNNQNQDFIMRLVNYLIARNGNIDNEIELKLARLISFSEKLKAGLQTIGIYSIALNPDDLISFLAEIINLKIPYQESSSDYNYLDPIHKQISRFGNHLKIEDEQLIINASDQKEQQVALRCFSVENYPKIWSQWQNRDLIGDYFNDLRQMQYPFITSFSAYLPDNEEQLRDKIKFKSFNSTRLSDTPIAKYIPEMRSAASEWQFVSSKIDAGQKALKTIYQVMILAPKDSINKASETIKAVYKTKGWELSDDRYIHLQSLQAILPFNISEGLLADLETVNRTRTMVSWTCANLAPLQAEWRGVNSPYLMLFGRRGQPFFWDPYSNKEGNYNVAIAGKAGSGKSVFMQELVSSIRGFGGKVYVIDDGRSFMSSCLIQGGEFIEFGSKSKICLNPFSIISKNAVNKDNEYKKEVISLIKVMIAQMCRSIEKISDFENGLIEEAVIYVWNKYGNQGSVTHVRDYFKNHSDNRAQDLAVMMTSYTKDGIYGNFFEGEANIRLDNPLMVFELAELKNKKELQTIVMMFLMFLVSENMYFGDRETPIAIVIDEAWDLLHGEGSKSFIEGIARRARKYHGSLVSGTQSINDYYKNPAAIATIENSDWMILLSQKETSIEQLAGTGRVVLDENLKKILTSLRKIDNQYSECLIFGPSGSVLGRLLLDPYSTALYSSKAQDVVQVRKLQEQGLNLEDALEFITQNKLNQKQK